MVMECRNHTVWLAEAITGAKMLYMYQLIAAAMVTNRIIMVL